MIPSAHSTVYNVPYDYYSLMHYGKAMFAQPGKITIETLDSRYTDIIGTQTDASAGDYYKNVRTLQPILCRLLKKAGFLNCDYEYTNKMCCASCNAATPKDSGGPDMS
ncbi:hypothetical protein KIN20_025536 [Parelaphostrongylus tenuis]|uniref:Peptidase M12A domain-containing protein n=1 Tax=Parelaphostrongylus tenuis TaxID=148309 RepID=A0AAD5NAU2_PARTN|nr:hypothetical protein KIN20_025536 [Parelaphostrongylus tenuis]